MTERRITMTPCTTCGKPVRTGNPIGDDTPVLEQPLEDAVLCAECQAIFLNPNKHSRGEGANNDE